LLVQAVAAAFGARRWLPPGERNDPSLDRTANQNGAPNETAAAVSSHPIALRTTSHVSTLVALEDNQHGPCDDVEPGATQSLA